MDSSNLKPCKYCGSDELRLIYIDEGHVSLLCENCGLRTRIFERQPGENQDAAYKRLVEYWNK